MYVRYSSGVPSVNPGGDIPETQVAVFNGYTEFKTRFQISSHLTGRGRRGKIKDFSTRARNNMLKRIFSLSRYPSLFITLTYPKNYPADSAEWKRHLDNLFRTLRRDYPDAWFIWKLEPQKRGAPHFHLIGELGVEMNIHLLRKYLSVTWFRICGTGDQKHLKAGIQADYINDSLGRMKAYVCKYVGKSDTGSNYPEWALPGRFWGIHGRENMPPVLVSIVNLSQDDYHKIKRLIRKWLQHLSPSTRRYAARLKQLHSFFLLFDNKPVKRIIEFITGREILRPIPFTEYIIFRQPSILFN